MANYYVNGLFKSLPPNPKSTVGLTKFSKTLKRELDELNVPYLDLCCIEGETIFPLRANTAGDNSIEYFNGTAWVAFPFDVSANDISLNNGTVSDLALKLGADTNNGIYGISDTQMGFAVEGVLVGGANTTGLFTDVLSEQTNGTGVTVDGALVKDGGISANSMFAGFYPTVAQNNITAGTGGAIPVTNFLTTINSDAGGDAFTMANGTQIGQRKRIRMVVDGGGNCVISPSSFGAFTTITMDDAGDVVDLIWNGTSWFVIDNSGATIA